MFKTALAALCIALTCVGCATERAWLNAQLAHNQQPVPGAEVAGTRAALDDAAEGPVADVVLEGVSRNEIQPEPVPLPCTAPVWRAERAEAEWREAIALSRRRAGDYTPTINARIRAPRPAAPATNEQVSGSAITAPPCWQLRFFVTEGHSVQIRTLSIDLGAPEVQSFRDIVTANGLRVGRPFSEVRYEALKSALARDAEEYGYFDASFPEHRVDIYPEDGIADVNLAFAPGKRYAFGELRIDATELPLRRALIERMAPFRPGEPYLASAVDELRTRLSESGYFAAIDVHPQPDAASEGRVPVLAQLTPVPQIAVTAGAGFATDIGPRGQLGYENRYVNDRGHQANAALKASPVISDASLGYRIPSTRPAERWWTIDAGARRERSDETESDNLTLGARDVSLRASGWRRTLAIDLSHERFEVGADRGSSFLLVPSLRFERSTTTRSSGPLDLGWRAAMVVSGAHEQALSDASFLQLLLEGRYALAIGSNARVLARVDAGTSWVAGFAELPPTQRLYAGGDDSVRGYDFKALGPRDNQNQVRGGRHRITASLEYEQLFAPTWSAAVFVDSGNAFDDLPVGMRTGVGIGVRWHSPVGSVRLDLAHPLSDSDQSVRVHIGIGRVQ